MDVTEQTALRRSSFSSATGISTQPLDQDDNHRLSPTESGLLLRDTNPRCRLLGFVPTVLVVIITLGSASLILSWLLARQYVPAQGGKGLNAAIHNGSFIVYEGQPPAAGENVTGNLRVLTFSALVVSTNLLQQSEFRYLNRNSIRAI